jgi:hypothetical protein
MVERGVVWASAAAEATKATPMAQTNVFLTNTLPVVWPECGR